jgi:superfamily II DNA helicase RecQ
LAIRKSIPKEILSSPLTQKVEYAVKSEWLKKFPWDEQVDIANKEIFGNEDFRENQREIINCTKSGRDVLALIPTGGGKSLTF